MGRLLSSPNVLIGQIVGGGRTSGASMRGLLFSGHGSDDEIRATFTYPPPVPLPSLSLPFSP